MSYSDPEFCDDEYERFASESEYADDEDEWPEMERTMRWGAP